MKKLILIIVYLLLFAVSYHFGRVDLFNSLLIFIILIKILKILEDQSLFKNKDDYDPWNLKY